MILCNWIVNSHVVIMLVDEAATLLTVEWPDVASYFIETTGVLTRESMRNHQSLAALNQFESGSVRMQLGV